MLISVDKKTKEVMAGQGSYTKENLRELANNLKKDYDVYLIDILETFR